MGVGGCFMKKVPMQLETCIRSKQHASFCSSLCEPDCSRTHRVPLHCTTCNARGALSYFQTQRLGLRDPIFFHETNAIHTAADDCCLLCVVHGRGRDGGGHGGRRVAVHGGCSICSRLDSSFFLHSTSLLSIRAIRPRTKNQQIAARPEWRRILPVNIIFVA